MMTTTVTITIEESSRNDLDKIILNYPKAHRIIANKGYREVIAIWQSIDCLLSIKLLEECYSKLKLKGFYIESDD